MARDRKKPLLETPHISLRLKPVIAKSSKPEEINRYHKCSPYCENHGKMRKALCDAVRRAESSQDDILLRQRVKEYAEKLMFSSPLEFGRQAEDILWKKAFYEPVARFKSKRDQMSPLQQRLIEQLLLSGLGTYQQVLSRLELDFGAPLIGIIDAALSRVGWDVTIGRRVNEFPVEQHSELREWALQCAYRCLLALGDLSRYLHDLCGQGTSGVSPHRSAAFRFYHQAVLVRSSQGQPYNQLGTLTKGELAGLKETYFYFRCLLSSEPFAGAKNNLNLLFDKNRTALVMKGGMPTGGWENSIRALLSVSELLWQGEVPKPTMTAFVIRSLQYDQPLRRDAQFYALLLLLALDRKLTRNNRTRNEKELELHHCLCLRTCSKHPFNEIREVNHSLVIMDGQQNNCIIPAGQKNGSSGDSGSGSFKRLSSKPKIVRRRRAFGEGDSEDEDDNGGRGAGDGGPYANRTGEPDSDDDLQSQVQETEQLKLNGGSTKQMNGQTKDKAPDDGGESSDDSMSTGWSSSSDEDDESEDETSDDTFDPHTNDEFDRRASQRSDSGGRDKANGGKLPSPRLSPLYTLDKALSCRQLVKQVASEELLPAAKLFLDWLVLLSNDARKGKNSEDDQGKKEGQTPSGLPLRVLKYVADLANLLCVLKHRVMHGSDSTIEHVRNRLNELSAQNAVRKSDGSNETTLTTDTKDSYRKEFILPEDIHFSLKASPALRTSAICKKSEENAELIQVEYDWILSWEERSSLATAGQRAVYRMFLIADRAADICEQLVGATVVKGEKITFEQTLQEKISECISKEATPLAPTASGTGGAGRQNPRGRNGRGNNARGNRGERGAGDTEKQQVMMKSMAHAWLRHEVEGLEERLEGSAKRKGSSPMTDLNGITTGENITQYGRCGGGGPNGVGTAVGFNGLLVTTSLSPFVVVDSSALSTRLPAVRTIALQKRSMLIVPTCVVSHLDEMKKNVAQARDATRWLEVEMRKGSRYVRVQGPGEASKISLLKYPKRKDREAWHLFQLLECCHHLGIGGATNHGIAGRHGRQDGSNKNFRSRGEVGTFQTGAVLVSLLIARSESDLPSNAATLADAIGVKLIDIDNVVTKVPSARPVSIVSKSTDVMVVASSNEIRTPASPSLALPSASITTAGATVVVGVDGDSGRSNNEALPKNAGG
ncbi:uncharacterized protein LOC111270182 isoform X2 [Varroa jacobsoni]|uniref:uncharacterized protein LOC111270182 isoform X2 n=1 Tax=Varroa jacobsoni TaxID=62625 RepID=UPI000BF35355|nr:uncharacterized protein LOC111270182 isoform X2 [Varroa jacobsoni]